MALISCSSRQLMIAAYVGAVISSRSKKDALSTMTTEAMHPDPMRHANLLVGWRRVPPRFLKLCMTTTLLSLLTATTARVSSLEIVASLALLVIRTHHAVVNTAEFLSPALFVGREVRNACQFGKSILTLVSMN